MSMARGFVTWVTGKLLAVAVSFAATLTIVTWLSTVYAKRKTTNTIGVSATLPAGDELIPFFENDLVELVGEAGTKVQAWLDERGAIPYATGYDPDSGMVELTAKWEFVDGLGVHRAATTVMFCDGNDVVRLENDE